MKLSRFIITLIFLFSLYSCSKSEAENNIPENISSEIIIEKQEDAIMLSQDVNSNTIEYNAYRHSQDVKRWLFNDGDGYMLDDKLTLDPLLSFTREELRILRNYIYANYNYKFLSAELTNFFSKFRWYKATEDNVDNQLTEIDKSNIQFIQELENNLPSSDDINKIVGVWREAGGVPDQGYFWGDYIIMYPNGTFEYKRRNFNARRHRNQIYGGSRYGLWTTRDISSLNRNNQIAYINITEVYKISNGIDETIIYDKQWWHFDKDIFCELHWGEIE